MSAPLRIALVGPSRVGKSTTCLLLRALMSPAVHVPIAEPLYRIEQLVYELAGKVDPRASGRQDGLMLQLARQTLLQTNPDALDDHFRAVVEASPPNTSLVNDDVRVAMYPTLRELGFVFVRVVGPIRERNDTSEPEPSNGRHDAVIPSPDCAFVIDNSGTIEDLIFTVMRFVREIRGDS